MFRKEKGTREQTANICWIIEKAKEFQKNICFSDYTKAFNSMDHNKLWKILKETGIPDHFTLSWETRKQVKKQQLELDMEQQTDSKLWKEYIKTVHCHLACLTYMQSTSCEMPGWMNHKLESRLQFWRNINNLRHADDTTLIAKSKEELKSLLLRVKEEIENAGLKLNIQKTKIMASRPITSWEIEGKKVEAVTGFLGLQNI